MKCHEPESEKICSACNKIFKRKVYYEKQCCAIIPSFTSIVDNSMDPHTSLISQEASSPRCDFNIVSYV